MRSLRDASPVLTTSLILGSFATAGILIYILHKKHKHAIGGEFKPVATIEKLVIYPIKSLRGIELDSAEITFYGLKTGVFRDRQFIIAKMDGGFITQRQVPRLALLRPSIHGNGIWIDGPDMTTLKLIPKNKKSVDDIIRNCNVFGQDIDTLDCGEEAALWIQKYLDRTDVRMAQFLLDFQPRKHLRNLYKHPNSGKVTFQDDSTFLCLSSPSITDLNSRLPVEDKVSYRNFRPNFLAGDCKAYSEDTWKFVKLGDSILMYLEPCTRCILTTVNPETGVRNPYEPLKMLKTYRLGQEGNDLYNYFGKDAESQKAMKSPCFGSYFGIRKEGSVKVGDTIYAVLH